MTDLENGATSLLAAGGRLRASPSTTSPPCSRTCCSTSRPWCSTPPSTRLARLAPSLTSRVAPRCLPGRTSGSTRWVRCSGGSRPARPAAPRWWVKLVELAQELGCRALVVDGTAVHDLGASDVQELGYVLAIGAHYLRELAAGGVAVDEANAAGRVPARRDRRAVHDHRQAPRRTPALGADARAQRRVRGPPPDGAARGDVAADDDQVRPLGEHAAHLRGRLRRGCRRRGRRHRAPVRRAARAAGRVRPTDRAQHLRAAGRGVPRRQGRRPGGRRVRRREAHRRPRRRRLGGARSHRVGWQVSPPAWTTCAPASTWSWPSATARSPRASGRSPGSPSSPTCTRRSPSARRTPMEASPVRPYGQAFEALRDEPVEAKVFLATMGTVAAHTARATFATNLFAAGGDRRGQRGPPRRRRRRARALRRADGRLPDRARQGLRRVGERPRRGPPRGGGRVGDPRRQAAAIERASRSTTAARWVSTRSTSSDRTREKLA